MFIKEVGECVKSRFNVSCFARVNSCTSLTVGQFFPWVICKKIGFVNSFGDTILWCLRKFEIPITAIHHAYSYFIELLVFRECVHLILLSAWKILWWSFRDANGFEFSLKFISFLEDEFLTLFELLKVLASLFIKELIEIIYFQLLDPRFE
jgi:hypothetical protein